MARTTTLTPRELLRARMRKGAPADVPDNPMRPRTRADCVDGPRPCPWVGCRYHLFLNVTRQGGVQFPHGPDLNGLYRMWDTCALDVADRGGEDWGHLKDHLNMSNYGTRLAGSHAMAAMGQTPDLQQLAEERPDGTIGGFEKQEASGYMLKRVRVRRPDLSTFLSKSQDAH